MESPPPGSLTTTNSSFGSYPLKDIPAPHPHDVLCGRGGGTNNHVGNSHWRMLVAANKQLYVTLPKRQKMLLSRSIVNAVRSQNPPGRFLQKDAKSDLWYDVGDQRAQEKTSQALREGAPDIRQKITLDPDSAENSTQDSAPLDTKNDSPIPKKPTSIPVPLPTGISVTQHTPSSQPQQMNIFPNGVTVNAPPGSTPVMVYAMPQNGMPGVPMYQAIVTPEGNMVPISSMAPNMVSSFPQSVHAHTSRDNVSMPPPPAQSVQRSNQGKNSNLDSTNETINDQGESEDTFNEETMAMMVGALEPSGISFGSISMTSVGRLEPAGTSFGSMMSYTVNTKGPDMVDGGLEPIGTSFGSLSLNSTERNHLERALESNDNAKPKANSISYLTPPIFSQARSTGNLLECSDTESEDADEIDEPEIQASKTAEWEKLKAMLETHTNMQHTIAPPTANLQPQRFDPNMQPQRFNPNMQPQRFDPNMQPQHFDPNMQPQHFDPNMQPQHFDPNMQPQHFDPNMQPQHFDPDVPQTGFDRDFSNVSALSMGEFDDDFDNIAPVMPPPRFQKSDQDEDRERLEIMYLSNVGTKL